MPALVLTPLLVASALAAQEVPTGFLDRAVTVDGHAQSTPVEGAWVVTGWHNADGEAVENSQPGLFVFTKTHYSVMFFMGDAPRPD